MIKLLHSATLLQMTWRKNSLVAATPNVESAIFLINQQNTSLSPNFAKIVINLPNDSPPNIDKFAMNFSETNILHLKIVSLHILRGNMFEKDSI